MTAGSTPPHCKYSAGSEVQLPSANFAVPMAHSRWLNGCYHLRDREGGAARATISASSSPDYPEGTLSARVIDIVAPISKGQRARIKKWSIPIRFYSYS
jgi:hypothetical protein